MFFCGFDIKEVVCYEDYLLLKRKFFTKKIFYNHYWPSFMKLNAAKNKIIVLLVICLSAVFLFVGCDSRECRTKENDNANKIIFQRTIILFLAAFNFIKRPLGY